MGRRTGRSKRQPKSAKRAKHTDIIAKKRGPRNEGPLKLLRGETRRARLRQQHQQGKA
jgi:hypothetical protein